MRTACSLLRASHGTALAWRMARRNTAEGEEDDGFVAYHSSDDEGEEPGMPERRSSQTFLSDDDEGADGLPEEFDDDDELSDTAEVL